MSNVNFMYTVAVPSGVGGALLPLEGVALVPYTIDSDGITEGPQGVAYLDRAGTQPTTAFATDVTGTVSYWLPSGDYNIHLNDQESPPRVTSKIFGFTAPVISTNQIVSTAQDLIMFTGDLKWSMQVGDHGLDTTTGMYEWLLIEPDTDGGGRAISGSLYQALWQLLGSPALDTSGNFRLPNLSGRGLVATGGSVTTGGTTTSAKTLLELIGAESHQHTTAQLKLNLPALGITVPAMGVSIPALSVNAHYHTLGSGHAEIAGYFSGSEGSIGFGSGPNGLGDVVYDEITVIGGQSGINVAYPFAGSPSWAWAALGGTTDSDGSATAASSTATPATNVSTSAVNNTGSTSGSVDSSSSMQPTAGMNLFVKS